MFKTLPLPRLKTLADAPALHPVRYAKISAHASTTLKKGAAAGFALLTIPGMLEVGQMLTYISTTANGQWLEVRVDKTGNNGFVFKQFVK